jgi:microcin C transport system substrate-binding protein
MQPLRRFTAAFAVTAALALPLAAQHPAAAQDQKIHKAHGIAMHGDLKYPPDFAHFDYVNPDAPKGGMLKMGAQGTFDSFNPYIIKGNDAAGVGFLTETLLTKSADEAFSEYGLLAESVEWPEDRSWVTFRLRPEARWHDGVPITADDVIFSLDILRTKGHPFYRFYYQNFEKVTKLDERTVRIDFSAGENRELPLIAGEIPVLPKHYWEGRDFDKTTLEPPLGSGPYRISKFEPGRFVEYERVEDYWGKDLPVNKGLYNFDSIHYRYYLD